MAYIKEDMNTKEQLPGTRIERRKEDTRRKVTDTVLVGKRAWNLALNKAETQLWVVNGLSDDLTVIDIASAKALKSIPAGRVPYGVVLDE